MIHFLSFDTHCKHHFRYYNPQRLLVPQRQTISYTTTISFMMKLNTLLSMVAFVLLGSLTPSSSAIPTDVVQGDTTSLLKRHFVTSCSSKNIKDGEGGSYVLESTCKTEDKTEHCSKINLDEYVFLSFNSRLIYPSLLLLLDTSQCVR